ncbi:NACHT domain-containing protein [Embleya sp. NBC_00896]|uniref:NACHT domain-containing protein n=1 Tax=Embleya sp. NBC_00896 TaxID=2975961 RepID=UPI002F919902|nr:NACHT domain-containing protein [Embleya sp. NBC_00896]
MAVRTTTAVAGLVARMFAAPKGARTVSRPVSMGRRLQRAGRRLENDDFASLTRVLARRLSDTDLELSHLEPDIGEQVVAAVETVLGAGITMDEVQATHLDRDRLRQSLETTAATAALPTLEAQQVYGRLLDVCCAHVVEFFSAQPEFLARTAMETATNTGRILDRLGPAPDVRDTEFTARYTRGVRPLLDRAQLYGVGELTPEESVYALTTAYVDLPLHTTPHPTDDDTTPTDPAPRHDIADRVPGPRPSPDPDEPAHSEGRAAVTRAERFLHDELTYLAAQRRGTSLDDVLAECRRLVLEGPAGSGKTTLLRRVAVRCIDGNDAADAWPADIEPVPFVLKLRSFVREGHLNLPAVEEFTTATGSTLSGEQPSGWVSRHLRAGSATVLIDGVDELPAGLRPQALEWVERLCRDYPDATYIVTSRPGVLTPGWHDRLAGEGFTRAQLRPMTPAQVRDCVHRWHRAQAGRGADPKELDECADSLIAVLESRRDLSKLATSPLLCALVCALHRNSDRVLPEGRTALYRTALTMMLGGREQARGVTTTRVRLHPEQAERLLGVIAQWMTFNGRRSITRKTAASILEPETRWLTPPASQDPYTADELLEHLLRRSGLLQEPELGVLEFRHASFQDYLAAWEMVQGHHIAHLLAHADDPLYHDVVIMAVGRTQNLRETQTSLLRGLTDRAARDDDRALWLLAGAAIADAGMVEPTLRALVIEHTRTFVPPADIHEAREIAGLGEFAIDLLIDHIDAAGAELGPGVVLSIIRGTLDAGGDNAIPLLRRLRNHPSVHVRSWVAHALDLVSDRDRYIEDVLLAMDLDGVHLSIGEPSILDRWPALLPHVTGTVVEGLTPDDLRHLPRMPRLDTLQVHFRDGSGPVSLAPLARCPLLSVVELRYWEGSDLGALRDLHLTRLCLVACPNLDGLTDVAALEHLRVLMLESLPTVDLGPVASLEHLHRLDLSFMDELDLSPLHGMTNLEDVWTAHCSLDLEALPAALRDKIHTSAYLKQLKGSDPEYGDEEAW